MWQRWAFFTWAIGLGLLILAVWFYAQVEQQYGFFATIPVQFITEAREMEHYVMARYTLHWAWLKSLALTFLGLGLGALGCRFWWLERRRQG